MVASRKSVYPCWWRLARWRGFIVRFLSSTWQWYVCLLMEIAFWLLWLFKLWNYLKSDTSTLKLYWFNQLCGSPEHLKQPVSGKTFIFWFPLFLTCSFLISFLRSASYFSFWFVLAALWSCKKRERQTETKGQSWSAAVHAFIFKMYHTKNHPICWKLYSLQVKHVIILLKSQLSCLIRLVLLTDYVAKTTWLSRTKT